MSCQVIGLLGLLALHSGCPRPPWGQKAACWAKTVPLRVLGGPEEAQYQSKVCGNHDSNTDGAASGSRDQIWSTGPSKDLQGHMIWIRLSQTDQLVAVGPKSGHWGLPKDLRGPQKGVSGRKRTLLGAPGVP